MGTISSKRTVVNAKSSPFSSRFNMKMTLLLFMFLAMHLTMIKQVNSLNCYVCSSVNDPECDDRYMPNRTSAMDQKFMKACSGAQMCKKTIQRIYSQQGILKEIRYMRDCANLNDIQTMQVNNTAMNWYTLQQNGTGPMQPVIVPGYMAHLMSEMNMTKAHNTSDNSMMDQDGDMSMHNITFACIRKQIVPNYFSEICLCTSDACNANVSVRYIGTSNDTMGGIDMSKTMVVNNSNMDMANSKNGSMSSNDNSANSSNSMVTSAVNGSGSSSSAFIPQISPTHIFLFTVFNFILAYFGKITN